MNILLLWIILLSKFVLFFFPPRADPLSNMVLTFSSKEDAIAFAEKNGNFKTFL